MLSNLWHVDLWLILYTVWGLRLHLVVPNTPYSMCVQDSWEILEGVRGEGFSQGQEHQRQESCMLKKRKWPSQGWHKRPPGERPSLPLPNITGLTLTLTCDYRADLCFKLNEWNDKLLQNCCSQSMLRAKLLCSFRGALCGWDALTR